MRAGLLLLLLATAVAGGDEVVDLLPRWKKGDVCDVVLARTVRLRGKRKVGNAERAFTFEQDDAGEFRDKILTTSARGAPTSMERKHVLMRTTVHMAMPGVKSEKETKTDPAEGKTETVEAGAENAPLIELLERDVYRKGAKVGESWEAPSTEMHEKLVFKLVEVTKLNGKPVARIHVLFKAKVATGVGKIDFEVKGYIHFSLEQGRIVRGNLRGPVKVQLDGFGTMHGTISEETTLTLVEARS